MDFVQSGAHAGGGRGRGGDVGRVCRQARALNQCRGRRVEVGPACLGHCRSASLQFLKFIYCGGQFAVVIDRITACTVSTVSISHWGMGLYRCLQEACILFFLTQLASTCNIFQRHTNFLLDQPRLWDILTLVLGRLMWSCVASRSHAAPGDDSASAPPGLEVRNGNEVYSVQL